MKTTTGMTAELLKPLVRQADDARTAKDFDSVRALFMGLVYGQNGTSYAPDFLATVEAIESLEHEADESTEVELMAVGFLGLARIYFDAAISAFGEDIIEFEDLQKVSKQYETLFTILEYLNRAPQTIHGGVIDWAGEYFQDLVRYYHTVDLDEKAVETVTTAISTLENQIETFSQESDDKIFAGKLSSLAVLLARRGRLTGNLTDTIQGYQYFLASHQYSPNPQRKRDLEQMLLKDAVRSLGKVSLRTTIRAAMIGSRGLLSSLVPQK